MDRLAVRRSSERPPGESDHPSVNRPANLESGLLFECKIPKGFRRPWGWGA